MAGELRSEVPAGTLICPFLSTILMMPRVKAALQGSNLVVVDDVGPPKLEATPLRVACILEQCGLWYEEKKCCSLKRRQV